MRLFAFGALFMLVGCGRRESRGVDSVAAISLPPELAQVLHDYERAYAAQDSSALAALFAEDAYLLPLGRPPVGGGPVAAGLLAQEGGSLTLMPIAYALADSVAYIVGTFGAEESATDGGKFVLALHRDRLGAWRVAADIANPNGR